VGGMLLGAWFLGGIVVGVLQAEVYLVQSCRTMGAMGFGICYLAITGEFTLRIAVDGYLGGLGRITMQSDPS